MLGGSAVHFSLAASFFTEVARRRPGRRRLRRRASSACSRARGVVTDDIERVEGGETFFWRGHYEYDMNVAHTDDTQLNVFADFEPKLSGASCEPSMLFLGNIQPDLQRDVRSQCAGRLRGARLDEPLDRHRPRLAGGGDRRGRLPAAQRRRAADADRRAEPGPGRRGRRWRWAPQVVVAKRGEYGAALFTAGRRSSRSRASRSRTVRRSDRRRRQLRRRLPRLPRLGRSGGDHDDAARCAGRWATASVLASFNVEDFGTERVSRLSRDRDRRRGSREFKRLTHFEESG